MKKDKSQSEALGTAFSIGFSQGLPTFLGYPLASLIAYFAANKAMSPGHRAVCINQWVAHDGQLDHSGLRRAVRKVYHQQGHAVYDFYHYMDRPEKIRQLVSLTPKFEALMRDCMQEKQGTLLLMPHLIGFNLGGLLLAQLGFQFLTLSFPNPNRAYRWQNKIRTDRGMLVEPMSFTAMQHARQRLEQGGTVLTGIDRPHPDSGYSPLFFGRPASLPVAYIRLALNTHARVFVIGFHASADHTCHIDVSDQVQLETCEDPRQELIVNAEKALAEAEKFIRIDPSQWVMFLPVWPEAESELPI
jgi:lauroyl/myristoyl acyltransferase